MDAYDDFIINFATGLDDAADHAKALAKSGMSEAVYKYITSLGVASVSQMTFTQKLKLSIIAIKEQTAAIWASPLGKAAIIAAGIFVTVKAIDWMTVSVEESREALAELGQEFKENESKIAELNGELETTVDRIAELEGKDTLTFTEAEELQNLKKLNNELEREIALLETTQKIKDKERNKAFADIMAKDLGDATEYGQVHRYSSENYTPTNTAVVSAGRGASTKTMSERDLINSAFIKREELIEAIGKELDDKERAKLEAWLKEVDDYLSDKIIELNDTVDSSGISYINNPTTDDEKAVNNWLNFIDDFNDKYMIAMGHTGAKTNAVNRLIYGQYSLVTKDLQELGKQGTVTAEHLADPKYDSFINKCIELGIITDKGSESLSFLALAFNDARTAAVSASGDISSSNDVLKETLSIISDKFNNVQSNISSLSESLSKLRNGTLGVNDVLELLKQFPELYEYVDLTADGFGNLEKGLENLIRTSPDEFIRSMLQLKREKNLSGDAAAQIDALCESVSNLSVDAIRDASGEFGVLAESINSATKAQNELEAALAGDDWDSGYEDRVEAFENFQETLNAGEYGSKAYSAYKDYFIRDDLGLDASGVKKWMEENQKYFTEGSEGVLLFMETVEQLGKQNEEFRNIASFDSRTGEFSYDIHQLDVFAKELGWTEEMLQDFIYKYRMYCEEWTSRSAQDNYTEFKNAGLIFEKGDKTLASLDGLLKYTNLSKEEIYNLIDAINELRRNEGSDPIEVIEPGQIQITQGLVNHLMGVYGSAELVEEKLREMVRGLDESDYTVEAGLKVNGKDVQKMLKSEEGSFVEVDIKMNVNNEEIIATVQTTADELKAILGKDWAVKLNGEGVEDVDEHLGNIVSLLMQLPGSTDVTITDSTETVRTNLLEVDSYLSSIASRSKQEIVITYTEQGRPIQTNATGTKRAKRGLSLLGDEYSPTGSPKPELVVSGDRAYVAGANGPEIGYLNDGDIVYTADETKRILRGNTLHKSFPAHAGGTAGDWIGLSGGGYSHSGKGPSDGKSDDENWFERQYKDHNHWIEMDKERMSDYLDWLDDAYKRAYDEGIIDIDEYYKYEEEILKKTQDLFKDHLNDIDHEISLLEDNAGSSDEIINLTLQAIVDIENELAAARAAGLDENGDYIQYLEQQWAEYSQTVIDMREDAEAEIKSSIDDLVEYRIDMLKQEIEDQKDALNEKLDDLQEFYDKQREMLQDKYDEEKYLEEQNEKRKSVSDIREELAMLEFDNSAWAQKRKLELQEELAEAEKELESFEKDHALDEALDMLDKQQEAQEAEIQAQIDALDEKLNDPHALFNQALADITNNTEALYKEFIAYNRKHGSGNDKDIADMWEEAYKADLEYQDTHNGEHLDGIAIGNYTGYVIPDAVDPPQPDPAQQAPAPEQDETVEPEKAYPYGRASDTSGTIKVGSNGENVKAIQYALNELGFGNAGTKECHGMFGPDTKRAVQAFQRAMGVSADGIVGNDTRAKFKAQGYALGTKSATYGIHEVEELGTEYIFESPSDGSRYRMFHGGEKVLNADATNFLYDFATSGGGVLMKMLSDLFGLSNFGNISKPVQAIEIHSGDIIVHGNANERTVSEIRRAQRENLEFVIKEFNQLNK